MLELIRETTYLSKSVLEPTSPFKWWVPEMAFEIVRKCLTMHVHYGYTSDLPFEQRLRDILGWQIGDGSAEISKLLIARHLMGKDFVG